MLLSIETNRANAKIVTLSKGLDQERMLRLIGHRLLEWIEENFDREGAEVRWAPMAALTRARKRGRVKLLHQTGKLRKSFGIKTRARSVEVGSPLELARWHHGGTKPSIIAPRSARALRFIGSEGPIFAARASHPGVPARALLPSNRLRIELAREAVEKMVIAAAARANRL